MQPIRISPYTLIWIGIGIGFLLGLIPLILGILKKKNRLGIYGFLSSVVGGAVSSILSFIIVGVFVWLILKKPDTETADSKDASNFEDTNSKVSESEVSETASSDSAVS